MESAESQEKLLTHGHQRYRQLGRNDVRIILFKEFREHRNRIKKS